MNDLLETARAAISTARTKGGKGVRATVTRSREARAEWRDGAIDRIRESTSLSLNLEIFIDGRYSSSKTSDLRATSLEKFIQDAVDMTAVLTPDPARELPDPSLFDNVTSVDLGIYDPAAESLDPGSCRRTAARLEAAARSAPGADRIVSATGECVQRVTHRALVTSNGMEGTEATSRFAIGVDLSVTDAGRTQPGWSYAAARKATGLPNPAELGKNALQRALLSLGSAPVSTGDYSFIVENRIACRLVNMLTAPLGGALIHQRRSFLADRIGERITSPLFNLIDDPHLPGGLSSTSFDTEGMATRKLPLFEKGVLTNYMLGTYYANKLGLEPTTAGFTNRVFEPGALDLKSLITKMGRGILVTSFLGGNSNSATGDFSVGIRGLMVEGGRVSRPVAEMNVSGNHLSFWNGLAEMGSDPYPYADCRTPSMLFESGQFSGV